MSEENQDRDRKSNLLRPHVAFANRLENVSEQTYAAVLLAPTFLIISVVAIWPLLETFWWSLHDDAVTGITVGDFTGVSHYIEIVTGQRDLVLPRPFWTAVWVTLLFAGVSVFFETVIGLGQALVLDQEFRGRSWVRMAIILPWAVPIVIQGMIFYLMFEPAVSAFVDPLQSIGLLSANPLQTQNDSLLLIIVADIWKTTAFMALIILAGLQSIDRSLYNVGRVAGATPWQRFRMITVPLVLPAVLVAMLFRTLGAMQVYGIIETMSNCRTVPSLTCMVVETFRANRYATSATIAFVTALIIAFFIMIYLVKFVDSLEAIGGDM